MLSSLFLVQRFDIERVPSLLTVFHHYICWQVVVFGANGSLERTFETFDPR